MEIWKFENAIEKFAEIIVAKIPSIAVGFLILIVGRYVIKFTIGMVNKRFERRKVDVSIRAFITSILRFVLYALLVLTVANTMGIQTTSFIAALSAFGLAVGMALQGSLSNFAGGVLILLFRPFEVGDYILSANGSEGTVERIDILYTTLLDADGIRIFSPNGTLANNVIKNYTKIASRRIQYSFLVSYDSDIKSIRADILHILNEDTRIQKIPMPTVEAGDLNENGVVLYIRAWTRREVFTAAKQEIVEKIQASIHGAGSIFPQASIKVLSDDK